MFVGTTTILDFLLVSITAGILGTASLSAVTYLAPKALVGNVGLVSTIGSIFTGGGFQSARVIGLFVHITAGIVFATLYCVAFGIIGSESVPLTVIGGFFGAVHGFTVFFFLINLLAEHHPVKTIRESGPGIGLVYFVAHVVFGLVVGATASILGLY